MSTTTTTNLAIVGCGFVASYYASTLRNDPSLHALSAYDTNPSRLTSFSKTHSIPAAPSYNSILSDPSISIIVNLTPPSEHASVSRAALLAGKHVYSEKPLALSPDDARDLLTLARQQKLHIAVAPCNFLSASLQVLARLVRHENAIGTPRVIYAELDDGPIHQLPYHTWTSAAGAPWPARTEFRVGCVWEHAAYQLGFLTAVFGPVASVTASSHTLVTDKMKGMEKEELGPDFCVAVLTFRNTGVVARLTIGTVARRNRSLTITGDKGILRVEDIWDYEAPVQFALSRGETEIPRSPMLRVTTSAPERVAESDSSGTERGIQITPSPPADAPRPYYPNAYRMNQSLGLSELASAIRENRRPRMAADHAFHVYEILHALDDAVAEPGRGQREIGSDFERVELMEGVETVAEECVISW